MTHGLYAGGLLDHERPKYHLVPLGTLDDELRMAKLKLARAYEAQRRWEEQRLSSSDDPSTLGIESVEESLSQGRDAEGAAQHASMTRRTIRRKRDFTDEIVTLTRLVARLEADRAALTAQTKSDDFVSTVAEKLRAFTEQAEATVPEVAE